MDPERPDEHEFDTLADDSYGSDDRHLVVTASIPADTDTSWFAALRERSGRGRKPIKYRHVRELFGTGCAGDLQRIAVNTIKRSLVVIEDHREDERPRSRKVPLRALARYVRIRRKDESGAKAIEGLVDLEIKVALLRSPLVAAGETVCEGMVDELVPSFYDRPEDLGVFTPRSTSTAVDLLDQDRLVEEFERRVGRVAQSRLYRDFDEEYRNIVADALHASLSTRPAFDKGAPAASEALNILRVSVSSAISPK